MSTTKEIEDKEAKDRRASRKAAAACLARQRHKTFVSGLNDNSSQLRHRVEVLRARKGHAVRALAAERPLPAPRPPRSSARRG